MKQHSFGNNFLNALKIAVILFVGFLFIVTKFAVQIDWPRDLELLNKGFYLNRFFADFFLYAGVFVLLYGRPLILRVLAYALAVVFVFVFLIQAQSFEVTGGFLPSIALENAQHADFLDTDQHTYALVVWAIFLILIARVIALWARDIPHIRSRLLVAVLLIVGSVLVKNDNSWLSQETLDSRFEFYNSGRPGIPRVSPINELRDSYDDYQEYLERENWVEQAAAQMSEQGARLALQYKLPFGALDTNYPLMRKGANNAPLRFLSSSQTASGAKPRNVIVFFVEGISARAVQPYSDRFPKLWPNVAEFSNNATRVDNYYNHAYATYRGLSGQLCSIYAVGRLLPETNYHCLGHELAAQGYDTRFMVSQRLDSTDLDDVAERAGFAHVDGAEQLAPLLSLAAAEDSKTITDKQLIRGLISRLREYQSKPDSPFAIGLYNFETHTGVRLFEDTTRYVQEGVASATTLDTFHNFDQAFGEFWDYFKDSPYYQNTTVVITSDHATYPSREFNSLMSGSPGYTPLFADQIPLLIYHPDGRSVEPIDAKNASAVNFAPSLLHLLDLQSDTNAFIGKSLFVAENSYPAPAASGGSVLWSRHDSGQWKRIGDGNRDDLPKMFEPAGAYFDYIKFTQSLERSNKLIKP
ncbi:MAG: hypothetical protein ACJAQ6_000923 [Arenicella sp.]|jgi:hypothetical protein